MGAAFQEYCKYIRELKLGERKSKYCDLSPTMNSTALQYFV